MLNKTLPINKPSIVSIVGRSDSGKTTLIEKLIPVLKIRGYGVGTIKHAGQGFQLDHKGKDSYRYQKAGADTVVVASGDSVMVVKKEKQTTLDGLSAYCQDVDLIVTEGFKHANAPKIEVFSSTKKPLFKRHAYIPDLSRLCYPVNSLLLQNYSLCDKTITFFIIMFWS